MYEMGRKTSIWHVFWPVLKGVFGKFSGPFWKEYLASFLARFETSIWQVFWLVLKWVQINFIFIDNVCILCYPAMSKSPKQLSNLTEKSRNNRSFNPFLECLLSGPCYTVIVSYHMFYMNHLPGDCCLYIRKIK